MRAGMRIAVVFVFVGVWFGWSGAGPAAAQSAFKTTVRGLGTYMKGVAAVKKKEYDTGIRHLSGLVDTYPGAKWQDGAHYWLACAYVAHDNPRRDIVKARTYFQRLVRAFPKSAHRWDAENYVKLIDDVLQPRREVNRIKEEMLKE